MVFEAKTSPMHKVKTQCHDRNNDTRLLFFHEMIAFVEIYT